MSVSPPLAPRLAHDVLRQEGRPLDPIFAPRTVAVIGATENPGSVGRTVLWNLIGNPFGGTVYPVNPRRPSVLGIKAWPDVASVPDRVDLAVIVTPAAMVPDLIGQCVDAGVRGAIVISAGFREVGPAGAELERRVREQALRGRLRLIGPNCLGVMNPTTGLNATFAGAMARPGRIAFISQSGALLTAILGWSLREQVGFSGFVSTGSMLDVSWGDLIDHFGDDPRTQAILIYMESIGDAPAFLSAARAVALNKPIIVIKAGRSEAAARAAASHTGSLAGGDEVIEAAFRRCGVLRVDRIADLFHMAEVLAHQPRPGGRRLTIVTNAGGPGVLATDALVALGGEMAALSPETRAALDGFLPPHWSHNNPIDVLGDADAERYARAFELAAADPATDGLLVVLTPQAMTEPTQTAERLRRYAHLDGKPVLASWMGGAEVQAGVDILNQAGIPTFSYPDTAAQAFAYMHRYSYNLRGLYETPALRDEEEGAASPRDEAEGLIAVARAAGRTLLTEQESKQLLAAYRLPTVQTEVAASRAQAVAAADRIGYPVVVKLHSRQITHKTDVGGVKLRLSDARAVAAAWDEIRRSVTARAGRAAFDGVTVQPMIEPGDGYELIVGASIDAQFGPVLLFGAGGPLVEVLRDRSLALPPLNATLARRMMEQTRILVALRGVRGRRAVDLAGLEQILVRFSRLVVEQPRVREIDINPLYASPDRLVALDARVVLHGPEVADEALPRPALRPYPTKYVRPFVMNDGTQVVIRPIRPEDEPLMVRLHRELSERTVRARYFAPMQLDLRVAHERLIRVCFADYERELALVAEHRDEKTGDRAILGVGRLSRVPHRREAEFALLVGDPWQCRGLGTELLRRLLAIARDEGLVPVGADILQDNRQMQHVCRKLGFQLARTPDSAVVHAEVRP